MKSDASEEDYGKLIEDHLNLRLALWNEPHPQVLIPGVSPPVYTNLGMAMTKSVAKSVLDSMRSLLILSFDHLSKLWADAYIESVLRLPGGKKFNEEIAALINGRYSEIKSLQSSIGLKDQKKIGEGELAKEVVKVAIQGRRYQTDPSNSSTEVRIPGIGGQYRDLLKEETSKLILQITTEIEIYGVSAIPNWGGFTSLCKQIFLSFFLQLQKEFPLPVVFGDGTQFDLFSSAPAPSKKATGLILEAHRFMNFTLEGIQIPWPQKDASGRLTLSLKDPKVTVTSDYDLASIVVESFGGSLPVESGPLYILGHGAGSSMSGSTSYTGTIPMFTASGMNAVAPELPNANLGVEVSGFRLTMSYLERLAPWAKRHFGLEHLHNSMGQHVYRPLVFWGRSMGSTLGLAHDLWFGEPHQRFDAYVLTSFSNPFTIERQTKSLQDQVAKGSLPATDPRSLSAANEFSKDFRTRLQQSFRNPILKSVFRHAGSTVLAIQGEDDRDSGGKMAVQELLAFRDTYAGLMGVYVFPDPLARWKENGTIDANKILEIDDASLEAQHVLASTQSDLSWKTKSAAEKRFLQSYFAGVPDEDLPKMQSQFGEMQALEWRQLDYLADFKHAPAELPELKSANLKIEAYRAWFLSLKENGEGKYKSFFEWYAQTKFKISLVEIENALPGRANMPQRLKRVSDFFIAEKIRVLEILKQENLIR